MGSYPMDTALIHHPRTRRGFNLVEAAIVLGVVGLVIGGIWVAAASVTRNMRIKETLEIVLTSETATSRIFKGLPFPTSETEITQTLISASALGPNTSNGKAFHGWGGEIKVYAGTSSGSRLSHIDFLNVPRSECIGISTHLLKIAPGIVVPGTYRLLEINNGYAWMDSLIQLRCGLGPALSKIKILTINHPL